MSSPAYEMVAFQFVADDGTEAGSTLIGALDSNQVVKVGRRHIFRIRHDLLNSVKAETSAAFNYEYSLEGGTWTVVTTSSSVLRAIGSGFSSPPADGDDCTQRLGAATFVTNNDGWDDTGTFTVPSFDKNGTIETELCCYVMPGDVSHGNTIDIRVANVAGYVVTESSVPQATVNKRRVFIIPPQNIRTIPVGP